MKRGHRPLWTCTHPFRGERTDQCFATLPYRHNNAMRILPLIVVVACVVCGAAAAAAARAQDEGEARPAPSRGLLKRGLLAKGKQTTTTTTPAPQEEAEYEDEVEYADGEAQEPSTEAPPSSTEGKKLVAGGVRPFRSNTDLLEALKRRRAEAAQAKHGISKSAPPPSDDSPVEVPAPAKSSYSKKRFNNTPKESNNEEVSAVSKPSRGRFGRPSSKSIQEEHEEQNESAPAAARAGRTFVRRAN